MWKRRRYAATAEFTIIGWEQTEWGGQAEGPGLSRATVGKAFTGQLSGESLAEIVMCQGDDGAAYSGIERFIGAVDGQQGSFICQHGAVSGGSDTTSHGVVVPGSGTGELRGLTGTVAVTVLPDGGHTFTLAYELEA